jgi:hypothetical protein
VIGTINGEGNWQHLALSGWNPNISYFTPISVTQLQPIAGEKMPSSTDIYFWGIPGNEKNILQDGSVAPSQGQPPSFFFVTRNNSKWVLLLQGFFRYNAETGLYANAGNYALGLTYDQLMQRIALFPHGTNCSTVTPSDAGFWTPDGGIAAN